MKEASSITPIILTGKQGLRPRFFLKLLSQKSLFQHTLLSLSSFRSPVIICHCECEALIRKQLSEIGVHDYALILEPFFKGTAAAIALGAFHVKEEEAMVIVPTHYIVARPDILKNCIIEAMNCVQRKIVMLGTRPSTPQNRYGYILAKLRKGEHCHPVWAFVEQPNKTGIKNLHQRMEGFWNTGFMVCRPQVFLGALRRLQPELYRNCERAYYGGKYEENAIYPDAENFVNADSLPVGFAMMEKMRDSFVLEIPADVLQKGIGKISPKIRKLA